MRAEREPIQIPNNVSKSEGFRMDAEARDLFRAQCDEARSILLLAERRREAFLASRTSAKLPSDAPRASADSSRSSKPNDLHAWVMSVQLAAVKVGKSGAFIMYARLCRRPRSAERSWENIAFETGLAVSDVKQIFTRAVPAFLDAFHAKGLTTKYTAEREADLPRVDAQQLPDRCFANEIGEPCPLAAA